MITCPPPRRTRSTVEAELSVARGRITTLRMNPEFIDDSSTARRIHDWYQVRTAFLERELAELTTRHGARP